MVKRNFEQNIQHNRLEKARKKNRREKRQSRLIPIQKLNWNRLSKPHTDQQLLQSWLDGHIPKSLLNEYEKPHTVIFLYNVQIREKRGTKGKVIVIEQEGKEKRQTRFVRVMAESGHRSSCVHINTYTCSCFLIGMYVIV